MINDDVISMPDTWEYPWYASWDLAFHTVALAMVDVDFAKSQLELMLRELYLHPSGQLPAYEWNFGDVNPPVHAWATLAVYETELEQRGEGDVAWLKSAFQKLLVNFTWWINRKDPTGRNVFEGGFLGLDNIGVFDRSAPLPTGGHLEQSDGTAWMAFFSQCMLGIALELVRARPDVRGHGAQVRRALPVHRRGDGPDRRQRGRALGRGGRVLLRRAPPPGRQRAAAQGAVDGRAPAAVRDDDPAARGRYSSATTLLARLRRRIESMPELLATIHDAREPGVNGRRMLAVLDETQAAQDPRPDARRGRVPEPARSAGACPAITSEHPFSLDVHGERYEVRYLPAESDSAACSAATRTGAARCGSRSTTSSCVRCCTCTRTTATTSPWSARPARAVSARCSRWRWSSAERLSSIFVPDEHGRRPMYGGSERFQTDPNWKDMLLFYEYFHGDNGAGLGASHQTGWTGLVARVIQVRGYLPPGGPPVVRAPREPRVPRRQRNDRTVEPWPADPVIYELNTAAWLHDVGERAGVATTLADVPAAEWDQVTPTGVDAVWLMGVWERSPAGVQLALESAEQVASFRAALPDLDDADVIGSAYCIRRYEVDQRFGGRAGPRRTREPRWPSVACA